MEEFRGTKGILKLQFVSGVCIGIGTEGNYSQMTANSILPDTDEDYAKEKEEIEANMKLYASSPELLDALKRMINIFDRDLPKGSIGEITCNTAKKAINKALGR